MSRLFGRAHGWLAAMALVGAFIGANSVAGLTSAQGADKVIEYNLSSPGKIDDSQSEDSWRFVATGPDRITITVDRTDGTLVPRVELRDSTNKVVASAEHDATFAHAAITNLTLPAGDRYTLVIGRFDGVNGKTSGGYKTIVIPLGLAPDAGQPLVSGELKIGMPLAGSLSNTSWTDTWLLNLDSTAPVTLTVNRKAGTLVPTIAILDAKFQPVTNAQPDATFAAATITNFTPPSAGQYFITIARLDGVKGGTSGDYQLTATR